MRLENKVLIQTHATFPRPDLKASVEGATVKMGTDWQELNHRQQRHVAVRFYRNIARIGLAMSIFWLDLSKYLS
jgi:hypothetical protein